MVRAIRVRKLYKDEIIQLFLGRGAPERQIPQNASYSAFPLRRLCRHSLVTLLALAGDAAKIGTGSVNVPVSIADHAGQRGQ